MIGQTIEAPRPISWGGLFFLAVGAALCVLGGVTGQQGWYVGAILPLLIGCALWMSRARAFRGEFTETALEAHNPDVSVAYVDIEGLRTRGRPNDPRMPGPLCYPIEVLHSGGAVQVPKRLNVPSDNVFHFLYAQFTPGGSREVNPLLREYLEQQVESFGTERVWSYRSRRHLGQQWGYRRAVAICLAIALTGVAWIVAGLLEPAGPKGNRPVWIGFGIFALILGLLFALLFAVASPYRLRLRKLGNASLVISPVGLALVQGDVRGELRWDELRDVRLYRKPRNFQLEVGGAMPGIHLKVEGATIVVADVYDRPLYIIHERIVQYWKHPQ